MPSFAKIRPSRKLLYLQYCVYKIFRGKYGTLHSMRFIKMVKHEERLVMRKAVVRKW